MKRYVARAVKEGTYKRHAEMRGHRASSQADRAKIRRLAFGEWMQDIRDQAAARARKASR